MRLIMIALTVLISGWIMASAARAQDRVALVIGNDRYDNLPADKQLAKAVNDARAIGGALEGLGFKVIRGENLTRSQMVDHIFNFTQAVKPGDTAVMFFAGHGVSLSGGNYLLPADVPLPRPGEEQRARNLSLGEADIIADIQERKPRVLVMMLDACRDNPFRQPGVTRSIGGETGLSRGREAEGVFTIYSAGFGQSALDSLGPDDKSSNSVFTRSLLPALARSDVHLADMVIDMREDVSRLAATVGHQQSPAYYDQTRGGRVYLAARPSPASPAPQQPAPTADPLGRVWGEQELDGWRSTWTRRGNTSIFDATFSHPSGARETATLDIRISNDRVAIERSQSNGKCRYEGRLTDGGRSAQGRYGCDWAKGPFDWKAEIRNSAAELSAPPLEQKPQAVASVQPVKPKEAPRRVALVIGNKTYPDHVSLATPGNDADAVEAMLREARFDDVIVRKDLTRNAMIDAFRGFAAQSAGAELALVYYSGHASRLGPNRLLLGTDMKVKSEADLRQQGVNVNEAIDGAGNAATRLVVIDADQKQAFEKAKPSTPQTDPLDPVVIYSAGATEAALDGAGSTSPFTEAFVRNFRPRGALFRDAFARLQREVSAATNKVQTPVIYGAPPASFSLLVQ